MWEWYNELQDNGRLVRIRELMKDLVWKRARSQPVLELLGAEFRDRNAAIKHITVLEVRSPFVESTHRAVVARGIRGDRQFQGDFADELFGLFVLNDSLTRVLAVLDMFPTPRWRDFEVELARVTPDSLYLEGRGATYGDQPLRRSYTWP
ncbi:MAG: hypothetical protein OER90_08135 [Gemmatimonadota bacterium]|nr:hypothetical protein [Gemmatimonadota bacterium]